MDEDKLIELAEKGAFKDRNKAIKAYYLKKALQEEPNILQALTRTAVKFNLSTIQVRRIVLG